MKRLLVLLGSLFVAGVAVAWVLYVTFPVQMATYGGMGINFLKSLSTPAGTLTIDTNPAYKAATVAVPPLPLPDAAWPNAAAADWPSYNRTLDVGALLAAQPNQHEERRQAEGLVHL